MDGNNLLSAVRNYVSVDSVRSYRKRAPLPMVQRGVLHGAISHLLLVLASHGPALGTKTKGLQIVAQGKVVYVLLVEIVDGVALKRALEYHYCHWLCFRAIIAGP